MALSVLLRASSDSERATYSLRKYNQRICNVHMKKNIFKYKNTLYREHKFIKWIDKNHLKDCFVTKGVQQLETSFKCLLYFLFYKIEDISLNADNLEIPRPHTVVFI